VKWAAEQARARGQTLRAVHAIDVSPAFNLAVGMGGMAVSIKDYEMDTVYRDAVAAVFDSIQPEPGWRLMFSSGEAGPAVVAESVGAALLVVGRKEHVGIGRLVSGSVSHYCLSHAQCPVVAVPAVRDHADQDRDQAAADAPAPA
jgi:nucleotide-binding universal stress UspA family protein